MQAKYNIHCVHICSRYSPTKICCNYMRVLLMTFKPAIFRVCCLQQLFFLTDTVWQYPGFYQYLTLLMFSIL